MCGLYAYLGQKNAVFKVFHGLSRLQYRGYDSWGIASLIEDKIVIEKNTGKLPASPIHQFANSPIPQFGVGHTRWATHGTVNQTNAHPHYSTDRSFCLSQNGIVENWQELKIDLLAKGYQFKTQTDTEVIVRLIENEITSSHLALAEAVKSAFKKLEGRNTFVLLSHDGQIIATRNGSPLVLGINQNDYYLSSDTLSFSPEVTQIMVVDNNQMVILQKNKVELIDLCTNASLPLKFEKRVSLDNAMDKKGFADFTLKEIHETPLVIKNLISPDYQNLAKAILKAKTVYTIGSGTAGASAAQIAYYLRTYARLPAVSLIGAEAREYYDLFTKNDLIIAPSQSGETADVLEVLESAKVKGVKIASFVNMPGSMMTRISDYPFLAGAGPEVSVLSTKVFVSQIAWGYLLAKTVAGKKTEAIINLKKLSQEIEKILHDQKLTEKIKKLAYLFSTANHLFLLGKSQNLQIIKEGMIKIIEGSYLHAHAISAGDLKHYAITIMEKGMPVIFVVSHDFVKKDLLNAVSEVKARGATIIGISPQNEESFDFYLPVPDLGEVSAIINIIPLQLLAYYLAKVKGHDIDRPRNIAKSVTVK